MSGPLVRSRRTGGIDFHPEFIISWDTQGVPRRVATNTLASAEHPCFVEVAISQVHAGPWSA